MSFPAFCMEQTTLTLTQLALGADLLWEPRVGTPEHDRCVDAYIPGVGSLQQKRATICIDFFNTVEATTMPYPFTRTYHISIPARNSPPSIVPFESFSSVASSPAPTAKPTGTKRAHVGASAPSKRIPGFSILTRDGVDVTENQSRGPKTKEQRDHAATMRKLGACPSCKRRKQKCELSHHRTAGAAPAAAATPMSSTTSARSSLRSLIAATPSTGTRASISPQSSLASAFTPPNMTAMSGVVSNQHQQPWEETLLSEEFFDDDSMLRVDFDDFTFGQDMFSQSSAAGNWDFASPSMGQDFDLFSYANTMDFDASLYVNMPSPLLQSSSTSSGQSSSLSPLSPQQPARTLLSPAFKQSMDTSQQPFVYDAGGQYLGNVNDAAGQYGIAVDTWDSGEFDSLEPDRSRATGEQQRQPQDGALGQGLQYWTVVGKRGPVFKHQQKYDGGQKRYEGALAGYSKIGAIDDENALSTMSNIGRPRHDQQKYDAVQRTTHSRSQAAPAPWASSIWDKLSQAVSGWVECVSLGQEVAEKAKTCGDKRVGPGVLERAMGAMLAGLRLC